MWKSTSARIELTSFGFHSGSTGYDKRREDLTPDQVAALAHLPIIETPPGPTWRDVTSYKIKITDQDGSVASYRAARGNVVDGGEGPAATLPTIDYEALTPFLGTLRCLTAFDSRAGLEYSGGGTGSRAKAATMNDDPGCLHGVFAFENSTSWLKAALSSPGRHRIETVRCSGSTRFRVLSTDGQTELAVGDEAAAPNCASIEYDFPSADKYYVAFETRNGKGGDSLLRIHRVP